MTAIAFPYLRPSEDTVLASEWLVSEDGSPVEIAGGSLVHFDYSATLRATRRIQIDFDAFAASIGADPDALEVECVLSLGTGGSRLDRRRCVFERHPIKRSEPAASLELSITGYWLSNSLNLTTELVLVSCGVGATRLAPRMPGARLWKDEFRLGLEPSAPRFPIEVVSFERMFADASPGAMWFLDWSPADLDQEFGTAVRLFINQDAAEFVERVHAADELTLKLLMTGVVAQMTRSAIFAAEGESLATHHAASSVGGTVGDWLARAFPGQTVASIRTLAEFDPARFEMALASLASEPRENA